MTDKDDAHAKPYVSQALDSKTLYFSITDIQSRMQLQQPDVLDLEYTRTMMGFLLFKPAPERIAMIGLGGGSIAKFCRRHLPRSHMTAVEINPKVIALRDAFQVPPDGAHFQVVEDDGARFVAQTDQRFDVLMIDAFDAQGTPPAMCTQRFYDDCMDALQPGGLLVSNVHTGDPNSDLYVERLRQSCNGHLLRVDDSDGTNTVVFASKGVPLPQLGAGATRRPGAMSAQVWTQLGSAYSRIAHAAKASSPAP
jgi:spermidine synthase